MENHKWDLMRLRSWVVLKRFLISNCYRKLCCSCCCCLSRFWAKFSARVSTENTLRLLLLLFVVEEVDEKDNGDKLLLFSSLAWLIRGGDAFYEEDIRWWKRCLIYKASSNSKQIMYLMIVRNDFDHRVLPNCYDLQLKNGLINY